MKEELEIGDGGRMEKSQSAQGKINRKKFGREEIFLKFFTS
jgi:hypothetical protein